MPDDAVDDAADDAAVDVAVDAAAVAAGVLVQLLTTAPIADRRVREMLGGHWAYPEPVGEGPTARWRSLGAGQPGQWWQRAELVAPATTCHLIEGALELHVAGRLPWGFTETLAALPGRGWTTVPSWGDGDTRTQILHGAAGVVIAMGDDAGCRAVMMRLLGLVGPPPP
jgi:hypothetical protein